MRDELWLREVKGQKGTEWLVVAPGTPSAMGRPRATSCTKQHRLSGLRLFHCKCLVLEKIHSRSDDPEDHKPLTSDSPGGGGGAKFTQVCHLEVTISRMSLSLTSKTC